MRRTAVVPGCYDTRMNARRRTFETSIGLCSVEWSERGLTSVRLIVDAPGENTSDAPDWVADACDCIRRRLTGEEVELGAIPLDLDGVPDFHRRVYEHLRTIPSGTTRSYGQLAQELGAPGAARAIGQAMARNPFPLVVPCHRVLGSKGLPGGFSAPGGVDTKRRLLELEGVSLPVQSRLFD